MPALLTLATRQARRIMRGRDRCDPDNFERYYSPAGEIEVQCTTDEREDAERAEGLRIEADVLDADTFTRLTMHLADECGLRPVI